MDCLGAHDEVPRMALHHRNASFSREEKNDFDLEAAMLWLMLPLALFSIHFKLINPRTSKDLRRGNSLIGVKCSNLSHNRRPSTTRFRRNVAKLSPLSQLGILLPLKFHKSSPLILECGCMPSNNVSLYSIIQFFSSPPQGNLMTI